MDPIRRALEGGTLGQELQDFITRAESGDHQAVTPQEAAARHDQIAGLLSSPQYQEVATKVLGQLSPDQRTQFAGWLQQAASYVGTAAMSTPTAIGVGGGGSITDPAAGLTQLNQVMSAFGGLAGGAATGAGTPGAASSIDPANLAAMTEQLRQLSPGSFGQLLGGGGLLDNPIAKRVVAGIAAGATRHVSSGP